MFSIKIDYNLNKMSIQDGDWKMQTSARRVNTFCAFIRVSPTTPRIKTSPSTISPRAPGWQWRTLFERLHLPPGVPNAYQHKSTWDSTSAGWQPQKWPCSCEAPNQGQDHQDDAHGIQQLHQEEAWDNGASLACPSAWQAHLLGGLHWECHSFRSRDPWESHVY